MLKHQASRGRKDGVQLDQGTESVRVVDLALMLGLGVGDTVELCRRLGIDVRYGVDELDADDLEMVATMFRLDLAAPTGGADEGPALQAVDGDDLPDDDDRPDGRGGDGDDLSEGIGGDGGGGERNRSSEVERAAARAVPAAVGTDELPADDAESSGGSRPTSPLRSMVSWSGRHRERPARGDSSGLEASADDHWVPGWIRRSVAVAVLVGLASLVLMSITRPDPDSVEETGSVGTAAVGTCLDRTAGVARPVSCFDRHDAEVMVIIEHPAEPTTPYPGEQLLETDAALRCESEQRVLQALSSASVPVLPDATVPGPAAWEAGDRTLVCEVRSSGPMPLTTPLAG